ncbi:MAG: hypothetical protein GY832_35085 [Chloroflexi bacterium]|nr:hypothetical protein [Chloroflexota bacterium]
MAKKSRRVKNKQGQPRLSAAQMVQPGTDGAEGNHATISTRSVPQVTDLQEEYRYVIADLGRIGIIALVMLAALIALAFLLT